MYIEDIKHLQRLKNNGFIPDTVIDIGVSNGEWFSEAYKIWPNAKYFLYEARKKEETKFTELRIPSQINYEIEFDKALGYVFGDRDCKILTFYKLDAGSSFYEEDTKFPRTKELKKIYDAEKELSKKHIVNAFLKLDVQGAEYEIIESIGRNTMFRYIEVIQVELSLLPYNKNAPLSSKVCSILSRMGFELFDFGPGFRRESDGVLYQIDAVFVKKESKLRDTKNKVYWLAEHNFEKSLESVRK